MTFRSAEPTYAPPLVLVIEDDGDFREQLAECLRRQAYQVRTAVTGEEGLVGLGLDPRPQLILLDLGLPSMSGAAFARVQQHYLRWAEIPVVVVSATPEQAVGIRAEAVLPKPLDEEALLAVVRRLCPHERPL